ncbi:MAG: hypothetical protein ACFFAU_06520 [Candidatus Hodarchaeota archaeon]
MNNSSEIIIKAISNSKRLEILTYIQQQKFIIKSDILYRFELKRASLDFHLTTLDEAGLIGLKEIRLNGRKYVFVYPKSTWEISVTDVETAALQEILPSEITQESFQQLTESLWINMNIIKDPQTIKKILEQIVVRLGTESSDHLCPRCESEPGIIKCSECQKIFCIECAKIIDKSNGQKISFCYDCIANQFS